MINLVLTSLHSNIQFNKFISGVYPQSLAEDLRSETYLAMANKSDEVLGQLVKDNKVGHYAIMIAKNNIMSNTSPFYKKYRKQLPVQMTFANSTTYDYSELRPIEVELIKSICNAGGIGEVAKQTDISYFTLRKMAGELKNKIQMKKNGVATTVSIEFQVLTKDSAKIKEVVSILKKALSSTVVGTTHHGVVIDKIK